MTVETERCVFVAYPPYQYLWLPSIEKEDGLAFEELLTVIVAEVVLLAVDQRYEAP